jgi:hypothetical protein
MRCACALAASRLRFVASAAFCARRVSLLAYLSAFSRASCLRVSYRVKLYLISFSSASRAFSSLVIAAYNFLSLYFACVNVTSTLRLRLAGEYARFS